MRLIIKIAKNELRNLFYSPIAWFLAIVLWVMCAFFYTGIMYGYAKYVSFFMKARPYFLEMIDGSITNFFIDAWFPLVLHNLYLFIPLLTMNIISRERNEGTAALLYSSPVKLRQIVLGKYLALMVYNLILILIMAFFVLSASFDIKSIDYGPLLSALLGCYLLLCALGAIGFFMSSLTTYPIVSAIASFAVLFALMYIGRLWQDHAFIRDLTYFLSISGRVNKLVNGLISTKDILYFLIVIYMFGGFTLLKLKAGREAGPWYVKGGRYLAVVASGLLIGCISSRPRFIGYLDTTRQQFNTLHPNTLERLQELDDSTLEVTMFTNILDQISGPRMAVYPRDLNPYLDLWEPYLRYKPGIKFNYAYYFAPNPGDSLRWCREFPGKNLRQIMGLQARMMQLDSSLFFSAEEMRNRLNQEPGIYASLIDENYANIIELKYRGRTTFLRMKPAPLGTSRGINEGNTEADLSAALSRLLEKKMPRVAFVSGELERSIYKTGEREYNKHTIVKGSNGALINLGFDVDTLNLQAQDIPGNVTMLVLADPKMELSPVVQEKIRAYIKKGGNMLILGEPGKQNVLNPILDQLGVRFLPGQIVQPTAKETPDKVDEYDTLPGYDLADEESVLSYKHWVENHIAYVIENSYISMPGVMGIQSIGDSGFTMEPILLTNSGKSWDKAGKLVIDSTAPVFDPLEGDQKGRSFPTAVRLSRQINGKEQRIVVAGDADYASNLRLKKDYARSIYSWLCNNEFPVYTPLPFARDNAITLPVGRAKAQKIVYCWLLPGLLLVLGTTLLVRRKRK